MKTDTRNHPVPTIEIELESAVRVIGRPGSLLAFSAGYLHSTVPNTSGQTRFSVDFRTAALDDLVNKVGAPNVDNESTGTTLRDFLRADDLSQLPDEIVELYDLGSKQAGVLVFDPGSS